ncbi:Cation efflux protein [Penicillium sp. IBT 18751x]|nr:Cation efflux protein [Penicillium sp. IBT 18751x]
MSTGAPPRIADLAPPSNGQADGHNHSHGHSRSRGHSRNARWAQPTPPIPLGSSNGSPSQLAQSPPDTANANYSYTHASKSSSVASVHDAAHDHRKAVSGAYREHSSDGSEQIHEVFTGCLIALPWIALSWYPRNCAQESETVEGIAAVNSCTSGLGTGHTGQKTIFLTAMTLLIFGFGRLARLHHQNAASMSTSSIKFPSPDGKTTKAAFLQILSIGLPIFATLEIGGFLVAFAILLAQASGLPNLVHADLRTATTERYTQKPYTIALVGTAALMSFLGMNKSWDSSPLAGYLALMLSLFVLSPPFPSIRRQGPISEPGLVTEKASDASQTSVLVTTDAPLALVSGFSLAVLSLIVSRGLPFSIFDLIYLLASAGLLAASLMFSFPTGLRSPNKVGLAVSAGATALSCSPHIRDDLIVVYAARCVLAAASFFASRMDDSRLRPDVHSHSHSHSTTESSRVTKWLVHRSEAYPLLHSILKEKDSRSIFYFMCLNFTFMLVQLSYGFLTGSLGLLSDSIHMFFDCLALVVGLCAAVMSKWPPNAQFPYGYGKVDTLSGFANGIFLMIISVEIIYEAVERLSSGSEMHRLGELLAVSIAGLAVNLVGIFSFEHGHHHGHDHGHGHDHSHGNENMHGIFLHILADTLGSVAVVISTILVHYTGWAGYDPLASCFIAILIFASAVPLVSSTAKTLLLTLPADTEYNVRETLAGWKLVWT